MEGNDSQLLLSNTIIKKKKRLALYLRACVLSYNMIKSPAHLKVLLHFGTIKMVVCSVIRNFFSIILTIFSCRVTLEPSPEVLT